MIRFFVADTFLDVNKISINLEIVRLKTLKKAFQKIKDGDKDDDNLPVAADFELIEGNQSTEDESEQNLCYFGRRKFNDGRPFGSVYNSTVKNCLVCYCRPRRRVIKTSRNRNNNNNTEASISTDEAVCEESDKTLIASAYACTECAKIFRLARPDKLISLESLKTDTDQPASSYCPLNKKEKKTMTDKGQLVSYCIHDKVKENVYQTWEYR